MGVCRALAGNVNNGRLIAGKGKVRLTRRLGVEASWPELLGRFLLHGLSVAKMPLARDDEGGAVVTVSMGGDTRVRRHPYFEGIGTGCIGIAEQDCGLHTMQLRGARPTLSAAQGIDLRDAQASRPQGGGRHRTIQEVLMAAMMG